MKMKYLDIAVSVVFILAVIIMGIVEKSRQSLYAVILAVVVFGVAAMARFLQNKKLKELSVEEK